MMLLLLHRVVGVVAALLLLPILGRCSNFDLDVASAFLENNPSGSIHTNNWAVLVDTSRFWFNYRHVANTLSLYHSVKRLGIPDSNIILMLADDMACNPRNPFPASVFNNAKREINLYGHNIEVDYRGYDVTVENFMRVLTGRHDAGVPRSKRLLTDERSNVLMFLTGHGGDEFLKFQDAEEITSNDLADAVEQMWQKRRYNEILFMVDTCQANSLYGKVHSPNFVAVGSSRVGEMSYSHHQDSRVGVGVIDRFTYYLLETLEHMDSSSNTTLATLFAGLSFHKLQSHIGIRTDLFPRSLDQVPVTDFFGHVPRPILAPPRTPSAQERRASHRPATTEARAGGDAIPEPVQRLASVIPRAEGQDFRAAIRAVVGMVDP